MADRTMKAQAIISARDLTGTTFSRIARKMDGIDHAARRMTRAMGAMALRAAAPAAMAYGAGKAISNFAALETTMTALGITADATDEQIAKAMDRFRKEGPALGVTAKEMGSAGQMFVAAGLDFETAINSVGTTVKAAKAAGASTNELADAGVAAIKQYGFTAETLKRSFEIMATGGKLGRVELTNMARLMPQVGVGAKRLGLSGEAGLAKSVAALEVLREGTGSAEEAANRWDNVVQKIFLRETQKNFKKMGSNLEAEVKKGAAKGKDALDVLLDEVQRLTKGDEFKISALIPDAQANQGVVLLLKERARLNALSKQILSESAGVIERDAARVAKTTAESFNRLSAAWDKLLGQIGQKMAPSSIGMMEAVTELVSKLAEGETILERLDAQRRERDIAAGRDPDATKKVLEQERKEQEEFGKKVRAWVFGDETMTLQRKLLPTREDRDTAVSAAVAGDLAADQKEAALLRERRDSQRASGGFGLKDTERRLYEVESRLENRRRYERTAMAANRPIYPYAGDDNDAREPRSKLVPLQAPLPPERPIEAVVSQPLDITGKLDPVELKGAATVNVKVTVEGAGRVTGMSASSEGHIRANAGTSMPHIANPAGR